MHSVLAAALFEASNSSGLIIRSDDPHNVVAFKQLLNDTIDGDLLNGFMEKAKTLPMNEFPWNIVDTAGSHWSRFNWSIYRSKDEGSTPSGAGLSAPGGYRAFDVRYPGDDERYILQAFGSGIFTVPANYNRTDVAWRGHNFTQITEGDKLKITFG